MDISEIEALGAELKRKLVEARDSAHWRAASHFQSAMDLLDQALLKVEFSKSVCTKDEADVRRE